MRIGLIAHGPGSANVISPLISPLEVAGFEVLKYPFTEYASRKFNGPIWDDLRYLDIFTNENLDLIIYGTGSMYFVEKDASVLAKYNNIKSISIMDGITADNMGYRYFNDPDYVICLNEEHKKSVLKSTDITEERILPFGNPNLEKYKVYCDKKLKSIPLDNLKVCYASEPNGNFSLNDTSERSKKVICELIDLLKEGFFKELIICLHPRESSNWIELISSSLNIPGLKIARENTLDVVKNVDACISVGSTVHYECILMKIPSFIYSDKTLLKSDLINLNLESLKVEFGSIDRIVNFIKTLV